MRHKLSCWCAVGALAVFMVAPRLVKANTLVATINGDYNITAYDTPSLHIFNTTGFAFTDVNLTLTAYQGLNKGISQSVSLADIAAGATDTLIWGSIPGVSGSLTPGNLFSYDYDDEYGGTFSAVTGEGLLSLPDTLVAAPQCAAEGYYYCADTGNFYVTFTAMWNGQSIFSQFSPDPTLPGAGNVAGVFVGWEGLDPNGWSETVYDAHASSGPKGVLANIYVGTPPPVGTIPEPATLCLAGCGLLLTGAARRKLQKSRIADVTK